MEYPNGCNLEMEIVRVERIFHHNNFPIVIRDLEMYVCPECGCEAMPLKSARIVEDALQGKLQPVGQFSAPLFQPIQYS